jgi:pimeloyl-ACP methyl ester carboxylesterase
MRPFSASRDAGLTVAVAAWAVLLSLGLGWLGRRGAHEELAARRPQEPLPPLPYAVEEIELAAGGLRLAGTLTLPSRRPAAAVLLLSGAGSQDRDGTLAGHRRYLVLADRLTRAGLAVLRTDDRGTGRSTGDPLAATLDDLAGDARAAVRFLRSRPEVDAGAVGLAGGSQGSAVAALAAADNPEVSFLVLLSPIGQPGRELLIDQQTRLARASGVAPAAVARAAELTGRAADLIAGGRADPAVRGELARLHRELERLLPPPSAPDLASPAARAERQVALLLSPAFRSALRYDPRPVLARSRQPVLVLGGGRDLQTAPEVNFPPLRAALAVPGRDVEMVVWPTLNHLLQPAVTGLPDEYARIETTLDERVPAKIAAWVGARFGPPRSFRPPRRVP